MLEIPTVAREGMVVNMLPSRAMDIVVSSVDDSEGISHIEASGSGMVLCQYQYLLKGGLLVSLG